MIARRSFDGMNGFCSALDTSLKLSPHTKCGVTNTGDRATITTFAAIRQISLAMSAALLPAPTMQTRFPAYGSGTR